MAHPIDLLVTAAAALATVAVARFMHRLRSLFLLLDAIGLVAFAIIGCMFAMTLGLPIVVVIVAGMITGCVLRDVLYNEIPLLFRSEHYASVSIVKGGLYVAALALDLPHDASMFGAMAFGLAMRLLALRFKWYIRKFIYTQDLH